jgi:hypothetical protein
LPFFRRRQVPDIPAATYRHPCRAGGWPRLAIGLQDRVCILHCRAFRCFEESLMVTERLTPAGGVVAQCSDEETCTIVNCAVCLKEIPADAVKLADAQDYVQHFCGLDCLEVWRKQAATRSRRSG